MPLKATKAAPGEERPFGLGEAVAACEIEDITPHILLQHHRAAQRLARRFGLPAPTARLVADLAFAPAEARQ